MLKKIMIVGPPRSGTTLLHQILAAHPSFFAPKETHALDMILYPRSLAFLDQLLLLSSRFDKWVEFVKQNNILILNEKHKRPVNASQTINFFVKILDENALKNKKEAWVEKTPIHLFKIPLVIKYAPEVCFLHVMRDPKDVVASIVDVSRKFPKDWPWFSSVERTVKFVNECSAESAKYRHHPNHYFVYFDKLIANPKEELKSILIFLKINYDDAVIQKMLTTFGGSEVYNKEAEWSKNYGSVLHQDRSDKFAKIFTPAEQDYIVKNVIALDK